MRNMSAQFANRPHPSKYLKFFSLVAIFQFGKHKNSGYYTNDAILVEFVEGCAPFAVQCRLRRCDAMHISSVARMHYSPGYCTRRWTDSIVNWSGRVCWNGCLRARGHGAYREKFRQRVNPLKRDKSPYIEYVVHISISRCTYSMRYRYV